MKNFYIGIDDTDVAGSPGTGYHARELAKLLEEKSDSTVTGITRHQLLVHPDIPYTSRNSSACLELEWKNDFPLDEFCMQYLRDIAPEGSDVGLCIIEKQQANGKLATWGVAAKTRVLKQQWAVELALESGAFLKGLTGTHDGIIGALAAVGLRSDGNDGRFIWLKGIKELRDLQEGIYKVGDLIQNYGITAVQEESGQQAKEKDKVLVGDWTRPVLLDHNPILLVENYNITTDYEWKTLSKDYIRKIS